MKIKVEYIIGISSIILGSIILVLTMYFPKFNIGEEKVPGPSFFPNLVAIFLIITGIVEFFEARKSTKFIKFKIENKRGLFNIISVIFFVVLYIFLLDKLGFIIITLLFCSTVMLILGVRPLTSIIYSIILLAILILIFEKLFKIPLPGGVFNIYI